MKRARAARIAVYVFVVLALVAMLVTERINGARAREIEGLVGQLLSGDVRARDAAEDDLGRLRDPKDIRILVESLGRDEFRKEARSEVMLVFARIGEAAIEPVMSAARLYAKPIGEKDYSRLLKVIRKLFTAHYDEERLREAFLRESIQVAIQGIGEPAVPALAAMLSDGDRDVRRFAVDALGPIQGKEAANCLAAMVGNPDMGVRGPAWHWLSRKIEGPAKLKIKAGSPADIAALRDGLERAEVGTRRAAIVVLSAMEGAEAEEVLTSATADSDASTRRLAVQGLALRGDKKALPAMVDDIRKGEGDDKAVIILSYFDEEEAVSTLIGIARDAESKLRGSAISGLGNIAGRKTADAEQRARAVGALEEMIRQGDRETRYLAVTAFANSGNEAAVEYLVTDLESTNWWIRETAAFFLAKKWKNTDGVRVLLKDLGNEEAGARFCAARYLGAIGDPDTEEALRKLVDDPDTTVRDYARSALWNIKIRSAQRERGLEVEE